MSVATFSYRPDIDGLRALAVLGVVIFHFSPAALPGGFIGVDVFFVISGYLISKTIYSEVQSEKFSIIEFYERRARRILPAFIVISLATAIAAWLLLFPVELIDFSKSLLWSGIFASNFWFWLTSDYFSPAADKIPLLHYWSLGIEEQFYVVFPVLVLLIHKISYRSLPLIIASLFLLSLAGSEWMLSQDPNQAFYMLPWRAFELLAGSLLAFIPAASRRKTAMSYGAVVAGVILIAVGMWLITEKMRFPGVLALVPCMATALVIWGGGQASWLLSKPPLTWIGKISYSLYLIHWPIVVFGKRAFPATSTATFAFIGICASIALAGVSYLAVEQPVRRWRKIFTRPVLFVFSSVSIIVLMVMAVVTIISGGFPSRFEASAKLSTTVTATPTLAGLSVNDAMAFQKFDFEALFRQGACFLRPEQTYKDYRDDLCFPITGSVIALWGDSHIAQYVEGLSSALGKDGFTIAQLTASACPPLVGVDVASRPNCKEFNDFAIFKLRKMRPALVVLSAVWTADPAQIAEIDKTIELLVASGVRVKIFGPSPIYKQSVPLLLAQRLQKTNFSAFSDEDMESVVFDRDAVLLRHFANRHDVEYISILSAVCPEKRCPIFANGAALHFDIAHLTSAGSALYGKRLAPLITAKSESH